MILFVFVKLLQYLKDAWHHIEHCIFLLCPAPSNGDVQANTRIASIDMATVLRLLLGMVAELCIIFVCLLMQNCPYESFSRL